MQIRDTVTTQMGVNRLPTIVLGAGPIGLAAAAHLHARGMPFLVLEAGAAVGTSIREWGHVKLFSPWRYLVDEEVGRQLSDAGWRAPAPDGYPTGSELVQGFLEPLAALPQISASLRFGHRVTAVARLGFDRLKTPGRERAPFVVVAQGPAGEVRLEARTVIDATGTWTRPNPLGGSGIPAVGEREYAAQISYGIPDVLGKDRKRYMGRRTLVVGAGHSAQNCVIDLTTLAVSVPGTEVIWAVRRQDPGDVFGGGEADELEERAALGARAQALVEQGAANLVTGFRAESIERQGQGLVVISEDGRSLLVDEIIAATGFRPDLDLTRELRLELDPLTEAPVRLAPLIDPNVHSCGTVPPHGEAELAHPETGYYMVGMKSYGHAPTFLLLTGYEQVRSVVAYLAGDIEAAQQVALVLPSTGVCCTDKVAEATCC